MKNSLNLSIANPCSENWSNFTTTHDGSFCSTCNKVVVDFTQMSDADIVAFFTKSNSTCGRFRREQLTAYQPAVNPRVNTGAWLLKAGFLSLFLVLAAKASTAQVGTEKTLSSQQQVFVKQRTSVEPSQTVKGIVHANEDNTPLEGVNIYLKNSTIGTSTDKNGAFTFPGKLNEGDTIVFSFIGYQTREYVIQKDQLDLSMSIDVGLVFDELVIMGDVATERIYEEKQSGFRRLIGSIKSIFYQ